MNIKLLFHLKNLLFAGILLFLSLSTLAQGQFVDGKNYYDIEGLWHSETSGNYYKVKYVWADEDMLGIEISNTSGGDLIFAARFVDPEKPDQPASTTIFLADFGEGRFILYQVISCFVIRGMRSDKSEFIWKKE